MLFLPFAEGTLSSTVLFLPFEEAGLILIMIVKIYRRDSEPDLLTCGCPGLRRALAELVVFLEGAEEAAASCQS